MYLVMSDAIKVGCTMPWENSISWKRWVSDDQPRYLACTPDKPHPILHLEHFSRTRRQHHYRAPTRWIACWLSSPSYCLVRLLEEEDELGHEGAFCLFTEISVFVSVSDAASSFDMFYLLTAVLLVTCPPEPTRRHDETCQTKQVHDYKETYVKALLRVSRERDEMDHIGARHHAM